MPGVGRCLSSQHRQLASNLVYGSIPKMAVLPSRRPVEGFVLAPSLALGTQLKAEHNQGMPADLSSAGFSMPSSSQAFGTLVKAARRGMPSLSSAGGIPLALHHKFGTLDSKMNFCTSAGDPVVVNAGDESYNGVLSSVTYQQGDVQALYERVAVQVEETKAKVLGFKTRFRKLVKPELSSRCLIVPGSINDPSTAFLHSQIIKIANQNPIYLGCFDIMDYESYPKEDDEWPRFLEHLVERKIHVIEDWDSSYSTIEILMYDHGLKQPNDGTSDPFYKGECDAAFDPVTGMATLSYIIWKDDKIVFSEVFASHQCSSAVDAEIYAACALLHKAEELKIRKILVCSDSKTVANILSGEQKIAMNHTHRDFYLMLRAMRSRFKRLVVSWKPRELMFFVDDLAKFAKLSDKYPPQSYISKFSAVKWYYHLRGRPIFRIERTEITAKATDKFRNVTHDESYATSGNSVYYVEVEEDMKFDCLVGLSQRLQPSEMNVYLSNYDGKSSSLKCQFKLGYRKVSEYESGSYPMFTKKIVSTLKTRCLVVAFDYTIPKDVYYDDGAFHVVFVTPSERESMIENIPELTALGFVYFNGVRLPLNADKKNNKKNK